MTRCRPGKSSSLNLQPSFDDTAPLPRGRDKQVLVRAMFDSIAQRYDMVNSLMTFGLDTRWRRRTLDLLGLAPGSVVVDLGCGTGDLCRELQARGCLVVGMDLSAGMLRAGRSHSVPLVQADAAALPVANASLDGIVSGFALRNFADLPGALREMSRALRPGGRLSLLEVGQPKSPVLRAGHAIWFHQVVPRLGGWFSDAAAYRYLPRSVAYLPPWDEFTGLLSEVGFTQIVHHDLSGGIAHCVTATRSNNRAR